MISRFRGGRATAEPVELKLTDRERSTSRDTA